MRPMRYDLDLAKIPLPAYRDILRRQNLLPSRRPLLQGLEENFTRLQALAIETVADLRKALSSPARIAALTAQSGVSAEYLTLLKREAGTLAVKPVPLTAFPDGDPAQIAAFLAQGIKTSKDYFETAQDRRSELYCLCDLVRINGVGPNAAKMLYDAGYRSPADIAAADAAAMLARVSVVNAAKRYYQGSLGLKDMQFCIDAAALLRRCVE